MKGKLGGGLVLVVCFALLLVMSPHTPRATAEAARGCNSYSLSFGSFEYNALVRLSLTNQSSRSVRISGTVVQWRTIITIATDRLALGETIFWDGRDATSPTIASAFGGDPTWITSPRLAARSSADLWLDFQGTSDNLANRGYTPNDFAGTAILLSNGCVVSLTGTTPPTITPTFTPSPTKSPTPTASPSPTAYTQCIWNWATQVLPEVTASFQTALTNAGVIYNQASAYAFGENCLNQQGDILYFAPMETDFRVEITAPDTSYETLGNLTAPVLDVVVNQFPPDSTPGPQPGQIELHFLGYHMDLNITIQQETAVEYVQSGLTGTALWQAIAASQPLTITPTFTPSPTPTMTRTITPTRTVSPTRTPTLTPTPTITPTGYVQCIWNWAYQDLPDVTASFQTALTAAGVSYNQARAYAFGENCLNQQGDILSFAPMETDFSVEIPAPDLSPETLGNLTAPVLAVVKNQFPPDSTPGAWFGQIEFLFVSEAGTVQITVQQELTIPVGLTGAALWELLNPTPTPTPTATASPTKSPTPTRTVSPTRTPTITPTRTVSPTVTASPTLTLTITASNTPRPTNTATRTVSPTRTPSPTVIASNTPSEIPSITMTPWCYDGYSYDPASQTCLTVTPTVP